MKVEIAGGIAALVAALWMHPTHPASACTAQSPAHTVALLELYTSEGCNSCPPADRWLSRLRESSIRADQVIALALHVDYWDRLGWPDRFASPRYTERQQALSRNGGSTFIYTPGVFLNLREFRGWTSQSGLQAALKQIHSKPALADIRLEIETAPGAQLPVKADFTLKPGAPGKAQAFVALFENNLVTDVRAGENRGVRLRHDYVVREWLGPIDVSAGKATYAKSVALDPAWKKADLGVAAFVQGSGAAQVLQAAALPYCK